MPSAKGQPVTRHNQRAYPSHLQWYPMTEPADFAAADPLIIVEGDGVWITDTEGKRYVDARGGLLNVNVGHRRPEVREALISQFDRIAYYPSFDGTATPVSIALAEKLLALTAPENMARVLFGSGGSDAVETALKIARQYWKLSGASARTKFISLRNAYHGTHFGGTSLNGNAAFRQAYEPLLAGCFQVETPWPYRNPFTEDPEELAAICATLLEREILNQGPETVAAFIAEPVQGAGGYIVPPASYWKLVREICDRHGVLMIADEVIAGFGRVGAWFGSRMWGVRPDIMCLAKGLTSGYVPLGATLINERIAAAWERAADPAAHMHGYSYSGHPLGCAAALAVIDITEREDLAANAARQGDRLLKKLQAFKDRFPFIGDVRGKGLMICLDLVSDRQNKTPAAPAVARRVAELTRDAGAVVRPAVNYIVISPPLTLSETEGDIIVTALDRAFTAWTKEN